MSKPVPVHAGSSRPSSPGGPVSGLLAAPRRSHRVSGRAVCPRRLYYIRYYTGAAISASQDVDLARQVLSFGTLNTDHRMCPCGGGDEKGRLHGVSQVPALVVQTSVERRSEDVTPPVRCLGRISTGRATRWLPSTSELWRGRGLLYAAGVSSSGARSGLMRRNAPSAA
jgi:hypothetical protein